MSHNLLKTLCLSAALLAGPALAEDAKPGEPPLPAYALILPANLPHVMRVILDHRQDLGLSAEQEAEVDAIMAEVPGKIRPVFEKARAAEIAIADDVMAGRNLEGIPARLDELQTLKREAADIHVACVTRVRAMLTPEQYARVLELSGHAGKGD
ncbi:MAG: hypothetical protein CSA74_08995 [Rhodobacterales bacterium]|nr:MAG: hypothetical protein CSA74_08995 [Rhodobacterales bacterium]